MFHIREIERAACALPLEELPPEVAEKIAERLERTGEHRKGAPHLLRRAQKEAEKLRYGGLRLLPAPLDRLNKRPVLKPPRGGKARGPDRLRRLPDTIVSPALHSLSELPQLRKVALQHRQRLFAEALLRLAE